MRPPCWVEEYFVINLDDEPFAVGSFGDLWRVKIIQEGNTRLESVNTFALKMSNHKVDIGNENVFSEAQTTELMYDYISTTTDWTTHLQHIGITNLSQIEYPTIPFLAMEENMTFDSSGRIHYKREAILMDYYPYGNIQHISKHPYYIHIQKYREHYVGKFLYDASFVLMKMWQHPSKIIDRDVKAANFLISGDLSNWNTTTFIKIDYGNAISEHMAQQELAREFYRFHGFCNFGTHMSPIDFRIMYGKAKMGVYDSRKDLQMQRDSLIAAIKLHDELESNDIIDLAATGAYLYDKLVPRDQHEDKIGFKFVGKDHDRKSREVIFKHNLNILKQKYNDTKYQDPTIKPKNIKELLIKFRWLSYMQLPDNEQSNITKSMLNWDTFVDWLRKILTEFP
eukprot:483299_1